MKIVDVSFIHRYDCPLPAIIIEPNGRVECPSCGTVYDEGEVSADDVA